MTDGVCEGLGTEWTDYIDLDDPDFGGDWELLENMGGICDIPIAIEAAKLGCSPNFKHPILRIQKIFFTVNTLF